MATPRTSQPGFEEIRIRVHDGVEIYGRRYPALTGSRRPLVCLAGLTRNSRDFHILAQRLAGDESTARDVYTIDIRGRGLSGNAGDWRQYAVPIEMLDVQDFMAAQHLHDAAILGTSRGGFIAMVLAAAQPALVGPVVLNDVGPVIERDGLIRISGFVGRSNTPLTWDDAARRIKETESRFFPALSGADWERLARQRFNEVDGKPAPGYDPELAHVFDAVNDGPAPELWPQFMALKSNPCLVIRGGLSDLLSTATVAEMVARHPNCKAHTVADEGHAPLLEDGPTQDAIAAFLAGTDAPAEPD
jgi:pimeloyl-ACP methyl ester carboxylesterase